MKSKRSRLALMGVLALVLSVTVGLVSGSVADAKKKKKKSANSITVSKTTPTSIPVSASNTAPDSLTSIPLMVGKKAKGKVVGWDSLIVTTTFTGSSSTALGNVNAEVTAPNGRTVGLSAPVWNFAVPGPQANTISGPLTETPNSPFNPCFPDATHPCPGGALRDPEATVGPNYAGTIGNSVLAHFGGVPARGTWTVKVFNSSTTDTAVLNSVSITMTLKTAPV